MPITLDTLDDDVLIHVFALLSVPEILSMRQTCKRMHTISLQRIVWHNACTTHVLQNGFPFPTLSLDSIDASELERRTCHTYRLAEKWLSGSCEPRKMVIFDATSSTSVSDVRFVPGHDGKWLLTVSKGIWSIITVWDIGKGLRKCSEWSPQGAIFNGFALNTEPHSEATLAISVLQDGRQRIEILSLQYICGSSTAAFRSISTIDTSFKPVMMQGDLLAFSDDCAQTIIWNWKIHTSATLECPQDEGGFLQHNRCIQVVLAYKSILVVRARSVYLFPEPVLRSSDDTLPYFPIAQHSFGWVDGVSVTLRPPLGFPHHSGNPLFQPLSILIRAESDDPWASHVHTLDLYTLEPNLAFFTSSPSSESEQKTKCTQLTETELRFTPPAESHTITIPPYVFPPTLTTQVQSVRGSLRCTDVLLGRYGTALWIHPSNRAVNGLVSSDVHQDVLSAENESLVAAAFPGPLNLNQCQATTLEQGGDGAFVDGPLVEPKILFTNTFNNWTSLDYDEVLGRIALGSSFGRVTILEL